MRENPHGASICRGHPAAARTAPFWNKISYADVRGRSILGSRSRFPQVEQMTTCGYAWVAVDDRRYPASFHISVRDFVPVWPTAAQAGIDPPKLTPPSPGKGNTIPKRRGTQPIVLGLHQKSPGAALPLGCSFLVTPGGFEPSTPGLGNLCSIP